MVERELDRKAHAFAAAVRDFEDSAELTSYLTDLLTMPRADTTTQLNELARRLAPPDGSAMPRMRWSIIQNVRASFGIGNPTT